MQREGFHARMTSDMFISKPLNIVGSGLCKSCQLKSTSCEMLTSCGHEGECAPLGSLQQNGEMQLHVDVLYVEAALTLPF